MRRLPRRLRLPTANPMQANASSCRVSGDLCEDAMRRDVARPLVVESADYPSIAQRRDEAARLEEELERVADAAGDDVAGLRGFAGDAFVTRHADAEGRRLQHQAVVASVADGDHALRPDALDDRLLRPSLRL